MQYKIAGLGRDSKKLANGRYKYYIKAWRGAGAPVVAEAEGYNRDNARDKAEALFTEETRDQVKALREERNQHKPLSPLYVAGLVQEFVASPKFNSKSKNLKYQYERYLTSFTKLHGDWRVTLFEKPETIQDIVHWRDTNYANTPRTADMAIVAVSALFKHARSKGYTSAEPTKNVVSLHSSNRSDIIWTLEDFQLAREHVTPEFFTLMVFAAHTAIRQGDLCSLSWNNVQTKGIVFNASKSLRHKRRASIVPILPEVREILDNIPKKATTVLTNTKGLPWTESGIKSQMTRLKQREPRLAHLKFHDLRGTACTKFIKMGLSDNKIALIMSWSEARVSDMKAKYVSADSVVEDMMREMEQEQNVQTKVQTVADQTNVTKLK